MTSEIRKTPVIAAERREQVVAEWLWENAHGHSSAHFGHDHQYRDSYLEKARDLLDREELFPAAGSDSKRELDTVYASAEHRPLSSQHCVCGQPVHTVYAEPVAADMEKAMQLVAVLSTHGAVARLILAEAIADALAAERAAIHARYEAVAQECERQSERETRFAVERTTEGNDHGALACGGMAIGWGHAAERIRQVAAQ